MGHTIINIITPPPEPVLVEVIQVVQEVAVSVIPPDVPPVIVNANPVGIKGDKGDSGNIYTFEAGENISSGTAVIVSDNKVFKCDPNNDQHIGRAFGIAKSSGITGVIISIQSLGKIQDAAFSFTQNKPCFVQADGSIGTGVPATTILQTCGPAINTNTLFINFQLPLKR